MGFLETPSLRKRTYWQVFCGIVSRLVVTCVFLLHHQRQLTNIKNIHHRFFLFSIKLILLLNISHQRDITQRVTPGLHEMHTNCRGGITADAMGWLEFGARSTLVAPERERMRAHIRIHTKYPGSGPSLGGKTPTPACLSLIIWLDMGLQRCSLS